MQGYINGIDWYNIEPMKYWSFPASYSIAQKKQITKDAIFGLTMIGSLKVDGYYQRLLKDEDGNCFMIARSRNSKGEIVNKIDWVPQLKEWMAQLPNGTCVLAEAYLPNMEGSRNVTSILGCLKEKAIERQKTTPLHFYIFDCMALNGENYLDTPYEDRIEHINEMWRAYPDERYIHYAQFFEGEELWNKLQEYLNAGREGMVIMRRDAKVYTKRTPAKVSIKIKMELRQTIDCVVLGANEPTYMYTGKDVDSWEYWFDHALNKPLERGNHSSEALHGAPIDPVTKAYWNGWAGSIKIGLWKDGRLVQIGSVSGVTEEILQNWRDYVGRVCEVTAMEITPDKALRHPKFLGWRDDKTSEECGWEQLEQ